MIANVQVLRAVAALMVVCDHIIFTWENRYGATFPRWMETTVGSAGVDLFFVISGFIMLETARNGDLSPISFLCKRLIRIVPLYWMLVLVLAARSYEGDPSHFDGEWMAQSLLFLPHVEGNMHRAMFPSSYFPILFVGWTLTFEMFFYVIFAAALMFRDSKYWPLAVPAFFLAMTVVAHWLQNYYLAYYDHPIILEFLYGMTIAGFASSARLDRASLAGALVAAGCVGLILGDYFFGEFRSLRAFMYGIPAAAIVYGAVQLERLGHRTGNGVLLSIGAASYSLYLIHPLVLNKAERLLDILSPDRFVTVFSIYSAAIAFTVLLALLSYRYFELPTQRYLRNILGAGARHGASSLDPAFRGAGAQRRIDRMERRGARIRSQIRWRR